MSEHDNATRIAAMLDGLWASRGGVGPHPPLHVSPSEFARFVAQGCPPERLRVVEPMPVEERS